MKNFKLFLLSLTFMFYVQSTFACIATTSKPISTVEPVNKRLSLKQKVIFFKDYLLKELEAEQASKHRGWFWGSVTSLVASAILFKHSDNLSKTAVKNGSSGFVPSSAGVGALLLGLLLLILGVTLFFVFLNRFHKEKKERSSVSPK